jgi:hypothetical protein
LAGYASTNDSSCIPCPPLTYSFENNNTTCLPCSNLCAICINTNGLC